MNRLNDQRFSSLAERDQEILLSLHHYRLLSTTLIRRLHFADPAVRPTGIRNAQRVLARLESQHLVSRLEQQIGGPSGGSSSLVWQLSLSGQRLVSVATGAAKRTPVPASSWIFARHTLAIAEVAVDLVDAERHGAFELLRCDLEPDCWQEYLGTSGVVAHLKPDLYVVTATPQFEDHWFIEIDLGTEHRQTIARKAGAYERYRTSGRHEAAHGVFPRVLWATPDRRRRTLVEAAVAPSAGSVGRPDVHTVVTFNELPSALGLSPASRGSSP